MHAYAVAGFIDSACRVSPWNNSPVLWREVYQRPPSRWTLGIWRLYGTLSVGFALLVIFGNSDIAPGTGAFIVSIGLLLVAVRGDGPGRGAITRKP